MTATHRWCVRWGTSGASNVQVSASNLNILQSDDFDQDGDFWKVDPIIVPEVGTGYSTERWLFCRFSGSFNQISSMKVWRSSGSSLSDGDLDYRGGTHSRDDYRTPVSGDSTYATTSTSDWTGESNAIAVEPNQISAGENDYDSDYMIIQLEAPDTVSTPGDIGTQTIYFKYDES